ncbi:MAG: hypothetical protein K1X74_22090 [Pirellulales bacterium]|nr:hypothetical protein [Pirellulales bacterium]
MPARALQSREYKCMLDGRLFGEPRPAAAELARNLADAAKSVKQFSWGGGFDSDASERTIEFLDTSDRAIALNDLVFRRRVRLDKQRTEYTLKCRTPDRYVSAGTKIAPADKFQEDLRDLKFEEDIAPPFASRFSHSATIQGPNQAPEDLAAAAAWFPLLAKLKRDGETCPGKLALQPVNVLAIHERVFKGPTCTFHKTTAEVALIIWTNGPLGRMLAVEFSFHYDLEDEELTTKAAESAWRFYRYIQRLDWCLADARTKTQLAYGAE